jgi:hypothetical protein
MGKQEKKQRLWFMGKKIIFFTDQITAWNSASYMQTQLVHVVSKPYSFVDNYVTVHGLHYGNI